MPRVLRQDFTDCNEQLTAVSATVELRDEDEDEVFD